MKKSFFIGLSLLLVATIGAFASANSYRTIPIFYIDNAGECVPGLVDEVCEISTTPQCEKEVINVGLEQIYDKKLSQFACDDPYFE